MVCCKVLFKDQNNFTDSKCGTSTIYLFMNTRSPVGAKLQLSPVFSVFNFQMTTWHKIKNVKDSLLHYM